MCVRSEHLEGRQWVRQMDELRGLISQHKRGASKAVGLSLTIAPEMEYGRVNQILSLMSAMSVQYISMRDYGTTRE